MGLPLFINAAVLSFSWTCRYRDDTVGALQDGKWILLVTAWIARHWILHLLFYCFLTIYDHKWRSITALSTTTFALLFSFSFKSAKLVWERKVYSRQCQQYHPLHPEEDAIPRLFRPRPLVFPSMIHHARIFPQKHSFSYPYLMVGIPVGWRGSVGTFLSADLKSLPWHGKPPPAAWLSVESADHLARGDHVHGLQGKLDAYLESIVSLSIPFLTLTLTSPVRKPRRIQTRIRDHCSDSLRLLIQSCIILVPLRRPKLPRGHDCRGEQYF